MNKINLTNPGITPLRHIQNMFGVKNLYIKDESFNPTYTFKDRLAIEALKPIIDKINSGVQVKRTSYGSITYGNTAFSLGYYCRQLNKQYGSEIVNAIGFIPPELKFKTFGPNTKDKYLQAFLMLKKLSEVCNLIEINLNEKIYREKELEEIARKSTFCFENFIDVTEGLDRESYEGVISEVIEQQLKHSPDYIIVPFGAGILCNEIIDYVKKKNLSSKVIPVSSGNPDTIAIMLYGPIWVNSEELLKYGKAFTKHDKIDRKGLIRDPYLVYNVDDEDILSVMHQLKKMNLSCEPSGASGFAILPKLNQISSNFNPEEHSVLIVNTGNGFLNFESMKDYISHKVDFLIKEYEMVKDEQRSRIDFRDRMIFVTLAAIGTVFSFVFEKPEYMTALLVLPFVCIVLGWTYLTNDERISEIGEYCRKLLIPKIQNLDPESILNLMPSWEDFHMKVESRKERKIIQLVIDLCIFCVSALLSIVAFFYLFSYFTIAHIILAIIQVLFIFYLGYKFISYISISEE